MTFPVVDFVPDGLSWRVDAYGATIEQVSECIEAFACLRTKPNSPAYEHLMFTLTQNTNRIATVPPSVSTSASESANGAPHAHHAPRGPRLVR